MYRNGLWLSPRITLFTQGMSPCGDADFAYVILWKNRQGLHMFSFFRVNEQTVIPKMLLFVFSLGGWVAIPHTLAPKLHVFASLLSNTLQINKYIKFLLC